MYLTKIKTKVFQKAKHWMRAFSDETMKTPPTLWRSCVESRTETQYIINHVI